MIGKKNVVAIIPARKGSKGLPGKNVITLAGKPLIAYTITAALKSRYVDRVVVSTDCEKIAKVARKYGAEAPFMRPKSLAKDKTHTPPVIQHAVNHLERQGEAVDYVLTLQPTSPLRRAKDIDAAVELIHKSRFTSVVSVQKTDYPPYWMVKIRNNRSIPVINNGTDYFKKERQQLPETYKVNGAVYITRKNILLKEKSIISRNCGAVVMDAETSLDIDTKEDLDRITKVMRKRKK